MSVDFLKNTSLGSWPYLLVGSSWKSGEDDEMCEMKKNDVGRRRYGSTNARFIIPPLFIVSDVDSLA